MTAMVHLAKVGDMAEAEEMEEILRNVGIEPELETSPEDDAVTVLVPESSLETAQEAIEALTEPDDLVADA